MKLTHVRLLVGDFSKSSRFYRGGLGLAAEREDNGAYAELDLDADARLASFHIEWVKS